MMPALATVLASASVVDNLLTAPVIAFVAAIVLTLLKFELRLPEALYPILSTYLLFAIGLKGGKALADASPSDIVAPLIAAFVLGILTPVVAYGAFRGVARLGSIDAAALAAHYGSVSAVTFTVVTTTLDARGTSYEEYVAGLLAVLEVIGIVVALVLARRGGDAGRHGGWRSAVPEVLRGRSIALLIIGIVVGAVVGGDRLAPTDGLFVGLFVGALTLFLIEMGVIAAERLRDLASAGPMVALLAVLVPLVNGVIGAFVGDFAGLSVGGVAVVATLAASASYIAAPAAVRIALPEASPGLYVTASLGVTFPFNLIVGIPVYIAIAERLA